MDEKLIEELKEKFMKNFPVEFTAIRPMESQYESLEDYHKYSVDHGKDAFLFHRRKEVELPALFYIPYKRNMVATRGHQFIDMGKKAGVLHDPIPETPFAEMVIGCNFTSNMSKNMAVNIISGLLDDLNAPFYTFISEAYALKVKKENEVETKISEHPDRKEIMMIHTCDQSKTLMTHFDIIDNKLGQEVFEEDFDQDRRGKFSNLFKEIQAPSKTN